MFATSCTDPSAFTSIFLLTNGPRAFRPAAGLAPSPGLLSALASLIQIGTTWQYYLHDLCSIVFVAMELRVQISRYYDTFQAEKAVCRGLSTS